MSLDIDALTQELAEIHKRKEEVDENLNTRYSLRGRGRGGRGPYGMGMGRGRGGGDHYPPDRSHRPYDQADRLQRPHDLADRPQRPYEQGRGLPAHLQNRLSERAGPRGPLPEPPGQAFRQNSFTAPKMMSAVVVNGQARMPTQDTASQQPEPGIAKRPRENADSDNPAAAKRNRRMFAGLLGTLKQFKKEDETFSQSRVAQQRAEARQRAEERAIEAERNARQAAKDAFLSQRREEINKKRELEMQARTKKLEIGLVARITHHAKLFNFLKTAAGPAVLWLPAHISSGMQQLLDDRQADFQTWQDEQREQLENQKTDMAARLQQTIARSVPARFSRKADEPRRDAKEGQAAEPEEAENGVDDGMEEAEDAEDPEEPRDSEEPAEMQGMPSPVALEEQDNPDVGDRYEGGQPSDEDVEDVEEMAEAVGADEAAEAEEEQS